MGSTELRHAEWRKSSYSGANGSCVEVARNLPGVVTIRDSKDREGPKLAVSDHAWSALIQGIKRGEFGL